jgi:hypothetical protein
LTLRLSGGAPGKEQEEVLQVGHTLYHKFIVPPTSAALPGGVVGYLGLSRWEVQHTDQPVTAFVGLLGAVSGKDPVAVVGRGTVLGTSTTEYRSSIPGSRFSGMHLEPYYLDLWLDHEGRVRRAWSSEVETGIKGRKAPLRFTVSTTFSDFGAPVHVQAPSGAGTPRS